MSNQLSRPKVEESLESSQKMNGSYSICLSAFRKGEGILSVPSPASEVVTVRNRKLRITFPEIPEGHTHWVVYGTRRGYGSVGPWYRVPQNPDTGEARTDSVLDIDWTDGELVNEND